MQLTFNSLEELKDFYNTLYPTTAQAPAKKKAATKPKTTKEPETTQTEQTEQIEETTQTEQTITMEELVTYVKTAFAPDAQPARSSQELVDMLGKVGSKKVSEIPAEKLGEAMAILKGE